MTQPKRNDVALPPPHWKVRIWLRGAGCIHGISKTEPQVHLAGNQVATVAMEMLDGTERGDTIGFIDWAEVSAVTWRYAALDAQEPGPAGANL